MNNDKVSYEHVITMVDDMKVYFVCSAAPKLEMTTNGAPKKCPICGEYNPAPLDGREEVSTMESVRSYSEESIVNQFVSMS